MATILKIAIINLANFKIVATLILPSTSERSCSSDYFSHMAFLQQDQNWIFGGFLKILVFAVFCPLLAFFRKFQSQLLSRFSPVCPCQLQQKNENQDLCTRHQGLLEKWYQSPFISLHLGGRWRTKWMVLFFWDGGSIFWHSE